MTKKMQFDYPYLEDWGGLNKKILRHVLPDQPAWSATNPSIGFCPKQGYAITFRSSNYTINPQYGSLDVSIGDKIRCYVWFSELDDELNLVNLRQISFKIPENPEFYRGVEDARLFSRNGEWYFTGVIMESHTPKARMGVFKLDTTSNTALLVEKYEGWDTERLEKNWLVASIESNPNFDFIYGGSGIYKDKKFILNSLTDENVSSLRGGSQLWPLNDGSYIAICHYTYFKKIQFYDKNRFASVESALRNYTHVFVRYSYTGKVIEISPEFVIKEPGIEFACGLVEKNGNFLISYGREDIASYLASISKEKVLSLLVPVEDEEF